MAAANLVVLGLETDYKCRRQCGNGIGPFAVADHVFTSFFVLEVTVALTLSGPRRYLMGEDPTKRCLDVFRTLDLALVFLRALDVWLLAPLGISTGLKVLSAFRVVHVGRLARPFALAATFKELWLILAGVVDALRTVAWVAALLLLVLWVFAVALTIVLRADATAFQYPPSPWTVEDYWGSVAKSMLSLFQVLTRDTWAERVVQPLMDRNVGIVAIFILFFCVASLALLNTIVGAVVESTLRSSRANEGKLAIQRQELDAKVLASLEHIFQEADVDRCGTLRRAELHKAMNKSHIRRNIKLLGLTLADLDALFTILDDGGRGSINTDTFFRGCTRLRGPAMARDLHAMSMDFTRQIHTTNSQIKVVQNANDCIMGILDLFDMVDTEIVKSDTDVKDPVLASRRQHARIAKHSSLRKSVGMQRFLSNDSWQSEPDGEQDGRLRSAGSLGQEQHQPGYSLPQPLPPPFPEHLKG